jgi:2-hydroxy-3-keto-5-methylthiopentenyl-1-phosphate phosphatase
VAGFDSGYGHDKSKAILPYRDLAHKPTLFFCGDGVSGEFDKHTVFVFVFFFFFCFGVKTS